MFPKKKIQHDNGQVIQQNRPKLILIPNLVKSRLPIIYFSVTQSFWNFAQCTAVILSCSVQNIKTIGQVNGYYGWTKFREIWVEHKFQTAILLHCTIPVQLPTSAKGFLVSGHGNIDATLFIIPASVVPINTKWQQITRENTMTQNRIYVWGTPGLSVQTGLCRHGGYICPGATYAPDHHQQPRLILPRFKLYAKALSTPD